METVEISRRDLCKTFTAAAVAALPAAAFAAGADAPAKKTPRLQGTMGELGLRKLGLIGGIGPESTVPYYYGIVYGVQKKLNRHFFPTLAIESINVYDVMGMANKRDYDRLTGYLLNGLDNLVAAKCEAIALTGNTPHVVLDRLQAECPVPIISIVQTACDEAKRRGYKRVVLLGTYATMDADFFRKPFVEAGIDIVVPKEEDKKLIQQRIGSELELGVVKDSTRAEISGIAEKLMKDSGAQGVVLGCTELPMLYKDVKAPFPTLDIMALHIQALIDFITSPRK
ncbi:MAG: Aspartate racemase [Burkholderia sp.]|jgi:aspartate racemase